MKVKRLELTRGYSGENPLTGTVVFVARSDTELKLTLDDRLCAEIVTLCAEAISRAGKEAARQLTADLLSTTAIEHKPDE